MSDENHKIQIRVEPHPDGPAATHSLNAAAMDKARADLKAQAAAQGYELKELGEIDPTQSEDPSRVGRIKAIADGKMAPKPPAQMDENRVRLVVGAKRGGVVEEFDEGGRLIRRTTEATLYGLSVDAETKGLAKALKELLQTPVDLAISAVAGIAKLMLRPQRPKDPVAKRDDVSVYASPPPKVVSNEPLENVRAANDLSGSVSSPSLTEHSDSDEEDSSEAHPT